MSVLIKLIGAIVFSVFMYCVPIVTTFAFVYDWDGFLKMILSIATTVQLIELMILVYGKAEDGE